MNDRRNVCALVDSSGPFVGMYCAVEELILLEDFAYLSQGLVCQVDFFSRINFVFI